LNRVVSIEPTKQGAQIGRLYDMAYPMRIDVLRSVAEAAGTAMAPEADQFEGAPTDDLIVDIGSQPSATPMDAGNYSRSWARPTFRDSFPEAPVKTNAITLWLKGRRSKLAMT